MLISAQRTGMQPHLGTARDGCSPHSRRRRRVTASAYSSAALSAVLWAGITTDMCLAGGTSARAAVGWSDSHSQIEVLDTGEELTVLRADPAAAAAASSGGSTAFEPPVDPGMYATLAAALWAVGLVVGGKFLLHRDEDAPGRFGSWLLQLLCLGAGASVAMGLGSFFLLLASGVYV